MKESCLLQALSYREISMTGFRKSPLVILPDDNNFALCFCYRIMALCLCNMFVLFEALRKYVLHADWDRFI